MYNVLQMRFINEGNERVHTRHHLRSLHLSTLSAMQNICLQLLHICT